MSKSSLTVFREECKKSLFSFLEQHRVLETELRNTTSFSKDGLLPVWLNVTYLDDGIMALY